LKRDISNGSHFERDVGGGGHIEKTTYAMTSHFSLVVPSRTKYKTLTRQKYSTIILPVVVYGCETLYFKLRKEHGLRLFEKRVLRKIFGPKRDEVTGERRKLHI
jgi:hypothetical protein